MNRNGWIKVVMVVRAPSISRAYWESIVVGIPPRAFKASVIEDQQGVGLRFEESPYVGEMPREEQLMTALKCWLPQLNLDEMGDKFSVQFQFEKTTDVAAFATA
jgi:hypothetical protein